MNVHHLKYPIAVISKMDVYGRSTPGNLQECWETEVDDGRLIGARIVDARGRQFVIKKVTKTRNTNLLPLFLVARKKRMTEIELEISEIDRLSVDEFRTLVTDAMKAVDAATKNAVFEDSGLLRAARGSDTYREIIENTGIDY